MLRENETCNESYNKIRACKSLKRQEASMEVSTEIKNGPRPFSRQNDCPLSFDACVHHYTFTETRFFSRLIILANQYEIVPLIL